MLGGDSRAELLNRLTIATATAASCHDSSGEVVSFAAVKGRLFMGNNQSSNNNRIELGLRAPLYLPQPLVSIHLFFIWPFRGYGIVGIGNTDNPC